MDKLDFKTSNHQQIPLRKQISKVETDKSYPEYRKNPYKSLRKIQAFNSKWVKDLEQAFHKGQMASNVWNCLK